MAQGSQSLLGILELEQATEGQEPDGVKITLEHLPGPPLYLQLSSSGVWYFLGAVLLGFGRAIQLGLMVISLAVTYSAVSSLTVCCR